MSFNLSPNVWVWLYLGQIIIISLALGCFTLYQPKLFRTNRLSRFLIGFSISPYIIGIWMMLAANILPGGPRWFFVLLPLIMALLLLYFYAPRIFKRIRRRIRYSTRINRRFLPVLTIYICAIFLIIVVTTRIFVNGSSVIQSHDALNYLTKALLFANDRTPAATINYLDSPDGVFRGDSHSFIFPAYLSHALLQTNTDSLGYPNDLAVRWAFQLTIFFMFLSILALASIFRIVGTGALSIIYLLLAPQLEYISYASSRDAFRVIPLALITVILASFTPQKIKNKIRLSSLIPIFIFAAFSLMGHTLGAIVLGTLCLAWFFWVEGWKKSHWRNIFLIGSVVVLGLVVGGTHYIDKYIKTGSIQSESTGRNALKGTPIEFSINPSVSDDRVIAINASKIERFVTTLQLDQGKLSIPGFLAGVVSTILFGRWKRLRKYRQLPFLGLIVFTVILPFSGLMDFGSYSLSRAFSSNIRYSLHWYPFLAVCLSVLTLIGYRWLFESGKKLERFTANGLLIVLTIAITYLSYRTITKDWRIRTEGEAISFIETIDQFRNILSTMSPDKRIFMNDVRYSYYLGEQVMTRFSIPSWPITRAKNEREVAQALSELNVGAVMFNRNEVLGWWNQLPLYSFLNEANNSVKIYSDNKFEVYRVIEDEFERTLVMLACIENQGCNIPTTDLHLVASKLHPYFGAKGLASAKAGNWAEVSKIFEEALKEYPNDLSLYIILAKAYQMQGRSEELYTIYNHILATAQYSPEVVEFLASELKITPDIVINFLAQGEEYQSAIESGVTYNFLDELDEAKKASLDNSTYIKRSTFIIDETPLGVIFQHPPAEVSYPILVPANASLEFSIALAPEVWILGKGDGVQFEILLTESNNTTRKIFSGYIDPKNLTHQRKWHNHRLNLNPWEGQQVLLTFRTSPGPNGDSRFDWAGWGEPRITQPVSYAFLDHFSEARGETLDTETGHAEVITQTINYDARPILFQHPSSQVTYSVELPEQASLQFGLGMSPEVWTAERSDGAEYNLYVRTAEEPEVLHQVYQRRIDPKNNPDDRRWFDERIDLSKYGGQQVEIIFEALPGPANNFDFDWGGWSSPVLIDETIPNSKGEQAIGNGRQAP